MKTLKLLLVAFSLLSFSACKMEKRHTTIVENSNGNNLKIEYGGEVYFNGTGTAIRGISPNGYIKYSRNGEDLLVKSDDRGMITYRVNGAEEQARLSLQDQDFVAKAVKDMLRLGHYRQYARKN